MDINVKTDDIEECFRIANKDKKEQPILVKFRDNSLRNEVFKAKGKLRDKKSSIFINEDLIKPLADLFSKVRQLKKENFIWRAWVYNSTIYYTKDEDDKTPKTIKAESDIPDIRKKASSRESPKT